MAGHVIDELTDKTAPGTEQARRKKSLFTRAGGIQGSAGESSEGQIMAARSQRLRLWSVNTWTSADLSAAQLADLRELGLLYYVGSASGTNAKCCRVRYAAAFGP